MSRRSRKTRSKRRSSYTRRVYRNSRPVRRLDDYHEKDFTLPTRRIVLRNDYETRRKWYDEPAVSRRDPPVYVVSSRRQAVVLSHALKRTAQRHRASEKVVNTYPKIAKCVQRKDYVKTMMRKLAAQKGSKSQLQKWRKNRRRSIDKRC